MATAQDSQKLVAFIGSLPDFKIVEDTQYDHMGALITDAMLQAGLNYMTTVKPRVDKIMTYPEGRTTSGFLSLLKRLGSHQLLNWNDDEKPGRVVNMTEFLAAEKVETVADLKLWLSSPVNITHLSRQRGVGPKTLDYIKNLAGLSTSAIDRHLNGFLQLAGIDSGSYEESQAIINLSAHLMSITEHTLDHSIWVYMSQDVGKSKPVIQNQSAGGSSEKLPSIQTSGKEWDMIEIGDVLISHRQSYHYVVRSIKGNEATILWLNRVSGEPVAFYQYTRKILITSTDYRIIRKNDVDRSKYHTPRDGWPNL